LELFFWTRRKIHLKIFLSIAFLWPEKRNHVQQISTFPKNQPQQPQDQPLAYSFFELVLATVFRNVGSCSILFKAKTLIILEGACQWIGGFWGVPVLGGTQKNLGVTNHRFFRWIKDMANMGFD